MTRHHRMATARAGLVGLALTAVACSSGADIGAPSTTAPSTTVAPPATSPTTPTTPATATATTTTTPETTMPSTSVLETESPATCDAAWAPPSLVDGSQPGEASIDEQEGGSVARWGSADSPFAVSQSLGFEIDRSWVDQAVANGRAIEAGDWIATTVAVGDPPLGSISIFLQNAADGCMRQYFVGPGLYDDEVDTLARLWVTSIASGEPVDPPDTSQVELGYFGRRVSIDGLAIDEFDSNGPAARTLPADDISTLFAARHVLPDRSVLQLSGSPSADRCVNRSIVRAGRATDPNDTQLPAVRSIAVTADGQLLATRDLCPGGARWGSAGTANELIAIDTSTPGLEITTLRTWPADTEQIEFEDDSRVIAFGERSLAGVAPDGRYVSLRESVTSDASSWTLIDLDDAARETTVPSACAQAEDVVGPIQFLGDGVIVAARLCTPLHNGDNASGAIRSSDVQVEAINLNPAQPSGSVVWSTSVSGVSVNAFRQAVGLSARRSADGGIWAIVTGNGDLDVSSQTFMLHEADAVEITRLGYQTFAFDPAELITEFDSPPS